MPKFIVHQAIKSEDMIKKEPNGTKTIAFVSDDNANFYLIPMGGGIALVHTNAQNAGKLWDGFIFDKNSKPLIKNLKKGLTWIEKHYLPAVERKKKRVQA